MAIGNNNLILSHLSGTIGNQITVRQVAGATIVSKKQKKKTKRSSEKQLETQDVFKDASYIAKQLLLDPDLEAFYASVAGPRQTAYNMALMDAYEPPEITNITTDQYIGNPGDKIIVRAIDKLRVYQVVVTIYTAEGTLLEEGNAILGRNGKDWTYTATKEHVVSKGAKIQTMAEDIPANKTYREVIF
ncbi:hypothetical protein SAMN05518672_1011082 [Chitinophaga sp. CF118]|uniref:hypothetical protein n=1 Tax=Chitinophaga sp. CF118 TaxID=1884367 RepID=UPI0008DFB26F|nr:hypothetical protein [Chitinophaga sp. CF118]SFD21467.1 hypothetical protein SAMN05518672_1011082 [Chitinophaga sp. CF118]